MKTVKCPWCGRIVSWHKGRLPRHVQSQHVQCVGAGQPQEQVERQMALHASVLADNARAPRFGEWWVLPTGQGVKFVGHADTRRGWQYAPDGITTSEKLHVSRPASADEAARFTDQLGRAK